MCFRRKSKMKSKENGKEKSVFTFKSSSASSSTGLKKGQTASDVTKNGETSGSIGTHVLSKNVVFRSTYLRDEQRQSTLSSSSSTSLEFREKIREMERQRQERFRSPSLELPASKPTPTKRPSFFNFNKTTTSSGLVRPTSVSHLAPAEPLKSTTRPVSIDIHLPYKNHGQRNNLGGITTTTSSTTTKTTNTERREQEDAYRLKSTPRGYCLIVANTNFRMASQLPGNSQDATRVGDLFRSLGFLVRKYENQTASQMRGIFQQYSTLSELRDHDSLVVFISTHGNHLNGKELFLGSDDDYIFREDILSYFNNRNCPNLIGKPKIFLIDACRGGAEDVGIPIQRNATPMIPPSGTKLAKKVPEWSDMLIYSSSVVGYVSWGTKSGSFFTMALVDVLKEFGKTHDFITILEKVTLKVVETEANSKLQAPSEEKRGWTKKLYFQ